MAERRNVERVPSVYYPAATKPASWPVRCDKCDQLATHHAVEYRGGQLVTKFRLCDEHADAAGISIKANRKD